MTNDWQKEMYDQEFAALTLDSEKQRALAEREAAFIAKELGLPAGAKVLDAPCGTGRHLLPLHRLGYAMTGIDLSEACLEMARKNCAGLPIRVERGDLSDLSPLRDTFDATLNLFSSFGYFSTDEENRRVLQELVSTLKPGGQLVLQLVDRDWLMKVFSPVSWTADDRQFVLEGRKYDPATHYNESWTVIVDEKTGLARKRYHRMRLYSNPEILELLREAGLSDVHVFGNTDGAEFVCGVSSHPIYFGTRQGS